MDYEALGKYAVTVGGPHRLGRGPPSEPAGRLTRSGTCSTGWPTAPALVLLLSVALAACEGSEGPTGPAGSAGPTGESGPGTRLVLSGTINVAEAPDTVLVIQDQALPPEAGTVANPPAVTCWLSSDGLLWFQNLLNISDPFHCALVASEDQTSLIVLFFGVNGWQYRVVVVY